MATTLKKTKQAFPKDISKLQEMASRQIKMKVTEMIELKSYNQQYDSYYICPRCKRSLEREFMSYCDRCGQKLDWISYKKAKLISSEELYNCHLKNKQ